MMKKIEEKLLKRIEELIKEGESLKDKNPYWADKEVFFTIIYLKLNIC